MTEAQLLNGDLSFHFIKDICVSSQSWEILENIKREYERKLEKAGDENELLRKEIKLFYFLKKNSIISFRRLENEKNKLEAEKEDLVNDVN